MSTVLVVLTAVSLVIALLASVVAWRVVRAERRRSETRARTLAAAIGGDSQVLFEPESAAPMPFPIGVAVGVCGAGIVAALVVAVAVFSADRQAPAASTPSATEPFELVALTHDRSHTALTVRGIVRNPLHGATRGDIAAVVHVYDARGELVASGRAPVASAALLPGEESTFVVSVPDAAGVERYRVSFRAADAVIPHVDRRAGA